MSVKRRSSSRSREASGKAPRTEYRVFISYSHSDLDLARIIVEMLREIVVPMWDENFRYGHGFHEQIKMFIEHAHVFLPIITEASSQRGWVHQEIGYAMAHHIPMLPVTVGAGAMPSEMIHALQAVRLGDDRSKWPVRLKKELTMEVIEHLVADFADLEHAAFQCAEDTEDRARLMVQYADDVRKLGFHGMVRQAGALSSFHIPTEAVGHSIWKERYGTLQRGPFHCKWQRKERFALEKHARQCGCRLIINPTISYKAYGPEARIKRLEWLLTFLKSMPSTKAQVAIDDELHVEKSVTIVGNWFTADAVSAAIGQGYRQTIFTRHAPSVQSKIELFDQQFADLLKARKWNARQSRSLAIQELEKLAASLGKELTRKERTSKSERTSTGRTRSRRG